MIVCVAWRFLSGETAITKPQSREEPGENQLRLNRQATQAIDTTKCKGRPVKIFREGKVYYII